MSELATAVESLLVALGEDPGREGLRDTPRRAAAFLGAFARPGNGRCDIDLTTFDAEGMDEMIVVGAIPFYSLCEHHILPFFGTATVGYVPNGRIIGLSKLPRLVQAMARGLQNQERITARVADAIVQGLHPRGVGVVLCARHLCLEMRGVQIAGAATTTSALRGVMFTEDRCRREFLDFHAAQERDARP
jgi:GTP cyclohydrolase IA